MQFGNLTESMVIFINQCNINQQKMAGVRHVWTRAYVLVRMCACAFMIVCVRETKVEIKYIVAYYDILKSTFTKQNST
jgi:hypothetical protein